jgi:hypothetical protein
VAAFRGGGAACWPDKDFEREQIMPVQEARYEADAWEENIQKYLNGCTRVTVGLLAREALFIETPRIGTAEQPDRHCARAPRVETREERLGGQRMVEQDMTKQARHWRNGSCQRQGRHRRGNQPRF